MRIIVGFEFSGRLRRVLRDLGHEAWSFDFVRSMDNSPYHVQEDVFLHLNDGWDMGFFFPSCKYVAGSGISWNITYKDRAEKTEMAVETFQRLLEAPISRFAVENSVGILSTRVRAPDQIIQPWQYGENASKRTCLWLKNLPKLRPTNILPGKGRVRRANQSPCGADNRGGSNRWMKRSMTYEGIALAMGHQWAGPATAEKSA